VSALDGIRDFLQLDDRIATSGMPRPDHFPAIRAAGCKAVINLALPTSDNAMPDEGQLVSAQGMTYVNIPVSFDAPARRDFEQFSRVMDAFEGEKVFVHCAANMRVSAFLFLHRLRKQSHPRELAEQDLRKIWVPYGVWREFVNARLAEINQPPLQ
jgi:protein tyrosine phosphatase (PTP) superfamily phosphohydrolase (DUF442 family)